MIKNVVGFFIGENSKKRQMGIGAFTLASLLYLFGVLDIELYKVFVTVIGLWTGIAFSAKMSKISGKVVEIKKEMETK